MESSESTNQLLKNKYNLHKSPEVENAAKRAQLRTGEKVPQDSLVRIQNYLNRFHEIIDQDDPDRKEHTLDLLKGQFHRKYIIKPENIPQLYWNLQGDIAVDEGRKQDLINDGVSIQESWQEDKNGNKVMQRQYTFPEDMKQEAVRNVLLNQQQSLDRWIDYLTSNDAPYPSWAKYWTVRSVLAMGKLEKTEEGKARFAKREKNTVASFPVLNQRALANTIGAMSARLETKGKPKEEQMTENLSATLADEEYQKLLSTEDFSKIYAQFLSEIPEYSERGLEETRGKWIKYVQGSDPIPLVKSLEGHPLEWCTADLEIARTQLRGGDFYVYYSFDSEGKSTIPRLAIRMEGARIAEPPRGIAHNQHLDPFINDVLEKKLGEFGNEGNAFKKRMSDMQMLTEIYKKSQTAKPFTSNELVFLYEIDSVIDGFGYNNQGKDPRIAELRSTRIPEEDMPIVFNCDKSQIARSIGEINKDTKAYVGTLVPGVFDAIVKYDIEKVYTSFPEGRIRIESLVIGGRSKEQLLEDLRQAHIKVSPYAEDMIKSKDFTTLKNQQIIKIVRLKVRDLGLKDGGTTNQVFASGDEVGLDSCPSETGVYQRLKDRNQPLGEWYDIAMKPIADHGGHPSVFHLNCRGDGLWLLVDLAGPARHWYPESGLVFSLSKLDSKRLGLFERLLKR